MSRQVNRTDSRAAVARGATSLYVANIVALVSNTLYFLVLTNFLPSTLEVGIVTALNIMITLLVTVCLLAQPVTGQSPIPAPLAVLKFLPELLAKNARGGAVKLFRASVSLTGLVGGVVAAVLIASPSLVIPLVGGQAVRVLYIALAGVDVLVSALAQVSLGSLIAVGDMKRATVYIVLWSIVRYGFASILLIPYAIVGVLMGFIVGDAVLLLIAIQRLSGSLGQSKGESRFSLSDLTRYSLYTLFSALVGFAINQADRLFTLAQRGLPELAIYNVAIVASSFVGLAPFALITVLLPALSALHAADKVNQMHSMIRSYTRYVSMIVIPIAVGFASVTEVALRIFGPSYTSGLLPSVIVSVATGLTATGAVYAATLLALGELRWYTAANILGLLALLAASAMLTRIFGLSGPALGRAGLMVTAAVVYAIAVKRTGFFELDLKAMIGAAGGSAVMGVVVFSAISLVHSFILKLAVLPILVVVGAGIYVGCLRLLHLLTADDLEFVQGILPTQLHPLMPMLRKITGAR